MMAGHEGAASATGEEKRILARFGIPGTWCLHRSLGIRWCYFRRRAPVRRAPNTRPYSQPRWWFALRLLGLCPKRIGPGATVCWCPAVTDNTGHDLFDDYPSEQISASTAARTVRAYPTTIPLLARLIPMHGCAERPDITLELTRQKEVGPTIFPVQTSRTSSRVQRASGLGLVAMGLSRPHRSSQRKAIQRPALQHGAWPPSTCSLGDISRGPPGDNLAALQLADSTDQGG
jgi:hypothetical protein